MGGVLKFFEFLNRGQMDRRLGPNWQQEEEDRQLKNRLLLEGNNRAEITSALNALDKLDELKKQGLAMRVETGDRTDDDYVREMSRRRDEDRQYEVDRRSTALDIARHGQPERQVNLSPEERAALGRFGVKLPEGDVSPTVLSSVTNLRGHEMSAEASRQRALITAAGSGNADDEATLKYYSDMLDRNPAMLGSIPSRKGNDVRSAVVAYRARTGAAVPLTVKMREMKAGFADAEAGLNAIEAAFKRYTNASIFSPKEANRARYAYSTQSKNYAALLGRAREKGIITQPDYERFLDLIYPGLIQATVDPELAQESINNARAFLRESKERRAIELGGDTSEAPPAGGDLDAAIKDFLSKNPGR